ncbi:uncharacterized protein [Littorina saxatilis]|uniref:Alpha-type protein kinase domain-containing protein n=1 Tax=Littorina saxatilis TaxID=31220 RepID=A0AAN9BCP7_9CAEN
MVSYSHTLSVKQGEHSVYRGCSFKSSPLTSGQHWGVHEGKIMDSLGIRVPAVVKISTNLDSPSAQVAAEMDMFSFARSVLERCPPETAKQCVNFVTTFHSEIDKVGKLCKWKKKNYGNKHNLREGAKVVVQQIPDGKIECLLNLGKTNQVLPVDGHSGASLLKLVHESYAFSRGQCVIAGVKGVKARDNTGQVTYNVTSLTIHSREKKYGEKDEGVEGIELYKSGLGLSHNLQPTAPPPELSDTNTGFPRISLSPPKFKISPVLESELPSKGSLSRNSSSQFLDVLGTSYDMCKELLGKVPQLRKVLSENSLAKLLGLPPSYSFTCA